MGMTPLRRAWITGITGLAALLVVCSSTAWAQGGIAALYVMKDLNLYGNAYIDGGGYHAGLDEIASGGWYGKIAIARGADGVDYLYLMKDGNLYGAPLTSAGAYATTLSLVASGGWDGELAVAGGHVYLMKDDNLYEGSLDGLGYSPSLGAVAAGGWTGRLAVARANNGALYLYLMKDGNLYGAALDGSGNYHPSLQPIASGGWTGAFAVATGRVCVMKDGNLYSAPLDGLSYPGSLAPVATGGWYGELAVRAASAPPSPTPPSPTPPSPNPQLQQRLYLNGSAFLNPQIGLRLTSAASGQAGSAWWYQQEPVAAGFDTSFAFWISGAGGAIDSAGLYGGDGFAFVIQNNGPAAMGSSGRGLGYDGIPNSLAVEFDT